MAYARALRARNSAHAASSFRASALVGGLCPADAAATPTRSRSVRNPVVARLMIRQPARVVTLWRHLDFERTRSWTIRHGRAHDHPGVLPHHRHVVPHAAVLRTRRAHAAGGAERERPPALQR